MRTRSQARKRRQPQVRQTSVESPNLEKPNNNQETFNPPIVTMDDNRTMAQFGSTAPSAGYEDAIVVPEINANNFEIKHGLLNLVQNKQFFGHDKEDPHAHIRYFNKITSTMKFPNVPSTSVKLMLFPFSLEGAARIWLDKEPPRSILTWDDLVSKFINKFFPPSKTTNLRNEIRDFQQKIYESIYEAWDRFNDLLRACPHHGFSELHQLDTFYNALNTNDQDSLNSAAGDLKGITTRSGVAYQGPAIPSTSSSPPKVMNHDTEVTKDKRCFPTNNKATEERVSKNLRTNPTCMTLELAGRSITEPIGIAKDVRLMVGKFQFLADFVVVDFEPDPRVPLILGRSFLKTSRALIDVYEGEITLRVGKEAITFNLDKTMKLRDTRLITT
ncbi:reverse transcriptase domain-containing protein [Tanacetum coccineum]